jgi:hypothetical protein
LAEAYVHRVVFGKGDNKWHATENVTKCTVKGHIILSQAYRHRSPSTASVHEAIQ